MYIYTYMYIHTHIYVSIYACFGIYIYISLLLYDTFLCFCSFPNLPACWKYSNSGDKEVTKETSKELMLWWTQGR